MNTDRELMQQALEALEFHVKNADEIEEIDLALVTALRERLAQPEQEPVATVVSESGNQEVTMSWWHEPALPVGTKLYTTPPHRKPLTDEEIEREWQFLHDEEGNPPDHHDFARAIEFALGIKGS